MYKRWSLKQLKPVGSALLMATTVAMTACSGLENQHSSSTQKDWPIHGGDYTNQRLSPLTQINTQTVNRLSLAWSFKTGVSASFQATPIVQGSIMYVALPFNHVAALDAKTGKEIWRYEHTRKADWKMCCGPANRGVAVSNGKVFIGTVDARLIALDAKSGRKLWDIDVAEDTALTENTGLLSKADAKSKKRNLWRHWDWYCHGTSGISRQGHCRRYWCWLWASH